MRFMKNRPTKFEGFCTKEEFLILGGFRKFAGETLFLSKKRFYVLKSVFNNFGGRKICCWKKSKSGGPWIFQLLLKSIFKNG